MCVITAYGMRCLGCWLLEVRCRVAGYALRMRDVARLAEINHSVASSWFFFSTHMQRCTDKHTSNAQLFHELCLTELKHLNFK